MTRAAIGHLLDQRWGRDIIVTTSFFAMLRGGRIMVVVPRFLLKLNNDWQGTQLELPTGNWHSEFSGEDFSNTVRMEHLFRKFPVALLVRKEND